MEFGRKSSRNLDPVWLGGEVPQAAPEGFSLLTLARRVVRRIILPPGMLRTMAGGPETHGNGQKCFFILRNVFSFDM